MKKKLLNLWYKFTSIFIWRCEKCHGTIKYSFQQKDGTQVYICTKCGTRYEIKDNFKFNDKEDGD